jgi:ATP-dependent Lon protease
MTNHSEEASTDPLEAAISAPVTLGPLDRKIIEEFPGLVVRKDLTKGLKQNAIVPTYVLEYLLGQHCATDDPEALRAGLESVQRILAKHYVHRNQAELVKSTIKEKGRHKVIDKVAAELNDKGGFYEARFSNLGLTKVPIADDLVRRHPKLLVGGIWSITELTYDVGEDPKASPWQIDSLKPIQVSRADYEEFVEVRSHFTTEEWMGLLLQSLGFNPQAFGRRDQLLQLVRLIPYCERNYNLIELGPKGTGKSHVYAEFSPHGILISGAEVTAAKLFVNNASGKIGLVGYWDCICFDEFAGKDKNVDKNVVDIMKNYMANKSFSRGIEQLSAEASMVFMGNTKQSMPHMLRHSHFFEPLPDKYIDSAFLDRIHAYLPGWEVSPVRNELFSGGYGFIVDYLAEILRHQRSEDFTRAYEDRFEIDAELSTRDQTGLEKTFSGMMKLIYPHGVATADEVEELLAFAMELRRRVREHILRVDDTFARHDFAFRRLDDGQVVTVLTPEEEQHPEYAAPRNRRTTAPRERTQSHASPAEDDASQAPDDLPVAIEEALESSGTVPKALAEDMMPADARPPKSPTVDQPTDDLMAAGESKAVEFKASARWSLERGDRDKAIEDSIVKTIAGFMNSQGGALLIGVNDAGEPVGLANDFKLFPKRNRDAFENWLIDLLQNSIGKPPIANVTISFESSGEHDVCRVDVARSGAPVYVQDGEETRVYVRFGNSTRRLNTRDAMEYVQKHWT